jgi:hypothetical protein
LLVGKLGLPFLALRPVPVGALIIAHFLKLSNAVARRATVVLVSMGTVAGILPKFVADVLGYNIVVVEGGIKVLAPVSGIPASGDNKGPEQERRLDSHNDRYRSGFFYLLFLPRSLV